MLTFLRDTRHYVENNKPVILVFGSETCDLDSAVSATCLAYFYEMAQEYTGYKTVTQSCMKRKHYIPVLNIPRDDYIIKTEVEYIFNKYAILSEMLTFRDDLSEELIQRSGVILVDHHVSPFIHQCLEIIDHQFVDINYEFPEHCKVTIENVASCSTLVAELILAECAVNADLKAVCGFSMLSLLRSPIILDTLNFDEDEQRATSKDVKICEDLEYAIEICANREPESRSILLESLMEAWQDVSALNVLQILRKNLKMLTHYKSNISIALVTFPLHIRQLIAKPEAEEDIQQFAYDHDISVIMLIGSFVEEIDDNLNRDIGLINIKEADLCQTVVKQLLALTEPDLQLEKYEDLEFLDGHYYKQINIEVEPKDIIPVVKTALHDWWNAQDDAYQLKHISALKKKISLKDEIE